MNVSYADCELFDHLMDDVSVQPVISRAQDDRERGLSFAAVLSNMSTYEAEYETELTQEERLAIVNVVFDGAE